MGSIGRCAYGRRERRRQVRAGGGSKGTVPSRPARTPPRDVGRCRRASWGEHADYVDARGRPADGAYARAVGAPIGREGPRVGLRCRGSGLAAAVRRTAAERWSCPTSPSEMTSIAAAHAESLGLTNVTTCVLDLEQIDQPDLSYDVVLCREGLMFALDPAQAHTRDPAGPAAGWAGRARRVGASRAQSLAGGRVRCGERPARHAGAAARRPGSVLAR